MAFIVLPGILVLQSSGALNTVRNGSSLQENRRRVTPLVESIRQMGLSILF
jgi:hypothetical protein